MRDKKITVLNIMLLTINLTLIGGFLYTSGLGEVFVSCIGGLF